jgi:hypothetical protein
VRQAIDITVDPTVYPPTDEFLMNGSTNLNTHSVLTGTPTQPATAQDVYTTAPKSPVQDLRYYYYGPGSGQLGVAAPAGVTFNSGVGGKSLFLYIIFPFVDVVLGVLGLGAVSGSIGKTAADLAGLAWSKVGAAVSLNDVVKAATAGEGAELSTAITDLAIAVVSIAGGWLAFVLAETPPAAIVDIILTALADLALFLGFANVGVAVRNWLAYPLCDYIDLPIASPSMYNGVGYMVLDGVKSFGIIGLAKTASGGYDFNYEQFSGVSSSFDGDVDFLGAGPGYSGTSDGTRYNLINTASGDTVVGVFSGNSTAPTFNGTITHLGGAGDPAKTGTFQFDIITASSSPYAGNWILDLSGYGDDLGIPNVWILPDGASGFIFIQGYGQSGTGTGSASCSASGVLNATYTNQYFTTASQYVGAPVRTTTTTISDIQLSGIQLNLDGGSGGGGTFTASNGWTGTASAGNWLIQFKDAFIFGEFFRSISSLPKVRAVR